MRPRPLKTRYSPLSLESLEPRILLSGVTIITHGAEFLSLSRPGWIDAMAIAIRNRVGPDTAIYTLRMAPSGGNIVATGFGRLAGPAPASGSNDETILLLDWAAASTVDLFGLSANYSTAQVASAVIPYLTSAFPSIGLTAPLAEGPIQLIGHSRGGSLISEIAKDLGQKGIWVDQVTTLDSVPVPPDPGVSLKSNVIFADNYYQHSGDGFLTPNGSTIGGAYNVGPLALGGAYGFADGNTHGDVHLFYQGTINTAANASDGSKTVVASWYPNNGVNRALTGFYFSRLGGGTRPASGLSAAFGGAAGRATLSHSGAQWANLATVSLASNHVGENGQFSASYRYNAYNIPATISWFIDTDTNPYNGNSVAITDPQAVAGTGDAPVSVTSAFQTSVAPGVYYLEGRISNATGTRYAYSTAFTLGNLPPVGAIQTATATAITGTAIDLDMPDAALTIRADADGTTFFTGSADIVQAGSGHGFSIDLTTLAPGSHRIDLYALDATSSAPTFIGTRIVYTNLPPVGHFDTFDGTTFTGWALDPNSGTTPSQLMYKIDSNPPLFATADAPRPDLAPNASGHGFSITLPQLKAGTHTVTVYAVDATTSKLVSLGSKSATVKSPVGNALPTGAITSISLTKIAGYATDATTPHDSLNVRVDIDGVIGTPFLTTLKRGSAFTAFSLPLSLAPGQHRIGLYTFDSSTGTPVFLASRIVGAASPRGAFETVAPAQLAGWIYSVALGGSAITYRIDIDKFIGNTLTTDSLHDIPRTLPIINGRFGFNIATPALAAGRHTVILYAIDPLTLTATKLSTKILITT